MNQEVSKYANDVLTVVRCRMFGMDDVIRLCLVAYFTNGHVLLEGNPGLGKTELVKTLGASLRLVWGRIQFTPDLMPADITGTDMPVPDEKGKTSLEFKQGPIFKPLLLADEINRATPKTQSAMLEAMQERHVTVLGKQHELPLPFMVLATQNPIDQEGTYNLPEAQADRFMFKIAMPMPDREVLLEIIKKQAGSIHEATHAGTLGVENSPPAVAPEKIIEADPVEMQKDGFAMIKEQRPVPQLQDHIRNMILASNHRMQELIGIEDGEQREEVERLSALFTYALGPRAAIALMLGTKAYSLLFPPSADASKGNSPLKASAQHDRRNRVVEGTDQPRSLARIIIPILRHRIKLNFDWQEFYKNETEPESGWPPTLLDEFTKDFCIATAPSQNEVQKIYRGAVHAELDKIITAGAA